MQFHLTHLPMNRMAAILEDDKFICICPKNDIILIRIQLKFVPKSPVDNKPALDQVMAWRWTGDKPLSADPVHWHIYAALGGEGLIKSLQDMQCIATICGCWSPNPLISPLFLSKHWLNHLDHIHILQVSPELSCCDTCDSMVVKNSKYSRTGEIPWGTHILEPNNNAAMTEAVQHVIPQWTLYGSSRRTRGYNLYNIHI